MSKLQFTDQEKEISECVSLMMNILGYNKKRTKERVEALNIISKACDIQTKHITHQPEYEKKVVGSLREGIGLFGTSDFDTLQIDHGVVVTENGSTVDGKVTFHMLIDGVPEGYCCIKLQHNGNNEAYQRLKHALVEQTNGTYLSSSAYTNLNDDVYKYGDGFLSCNMKYLPRNGPSIPRRNDLYRKIAIIMQTLAISSEECLKFLLDIACGFNAITDVVHALPCIQETILDKWRTRKRISGWPNEDMVSKAISLPVYVVPVGCKGAQNENLQWRISFVEAELFLVQSLNDTQRKVLILAKHITKNELKPISKHMKSYLVKMAVLWLAEEVPVAEFQQQHLIARLQDVLLFLKRSIANQVLPHFIVSERNLLDSKLLHDEHKMLISKLEDTIDIINKCVIRKMGDISEEIFMNYMKCALFNAFNIALTNDVRRKTAEELAASFINKFKCQSLWSFLFHGFKDNVFPLLYRNFGPILMDIVFPAYNEVKIFYFMIEETQLETEGQDETLNEEQSEIEGKEEALDEEQSKIEGKEEALDKEQSETEGKEEALDEEQSETIGKEKALDHKQSETKGKDGAIKKEQSEAGRKHVQTFSFKKNKTSKNQLSDPSVKVNTKGKKESIKKILQTIRNRQMIIDILAISFFIMLIHILSQPLQRYQDYESVTNVYKFWFLISILNKAFRQKAILILWGSCMFSQNYNFYADYFLVMKTLFTCGLNVSACGNETDVIAHNERLEITRIHISDLYFLIISQRPDILGDYIRLAM